MTVIIKSLILVLIILTATISEAKMSITNRVDPISYYVNHEKQMQFIRSNVKKYHNSSIIGMSGTGKTQIARMYAREYRDEYDIIWFFDCNIDLNIEFAKLAKELNQQYSININEHSENTKKQVMDYLSSRKSWLLVFDNLRIGENHKVHDIIDWEHNGNIIFVSQDNHGLSNIVNIPPFGNKDIKQLSRNLLYNQDEDDIQFLTEHFSGYPVMIVQAVQLINKVQGLDKEAYKQQVYHSSDKILTNIEMALKELTPSARELLKRIALINNQAFSKQFLKVISDNTASLDDDILQLARLSLISNTDSDRSNPTFEMHDLTRDALLRMNKDNINILEQIISKITSAIPHNGRQPVGHNFRSGKTVNDNLQVITGYASKYQISIYKLMPLNLQLFINYINTFQYYDAELLLQWFAALDDTKIFKLMLMSNSEKLVYARYLGIVSGYYKMRYADWNKALEYSLRALEVLQKVDGYDAIKCNTLYNIANIRVSLGQIKEAEQEIKNIENNKTYSALGQVVRIMKSKLFYYKGEYDKALIECEQEISQIAKSGDYQRDILYLTNNYLLRAEILNALGRYEQSYQQVKELYEVHKTTTPETCAIMSSIYIQMARSLLGMHAQENALIYINKAIDILFLDSKRNDKNMNISYDPDLGQSYIIKGDILFNQDDDNNAIMYYEKAFKIFNLLYKEHRKYLAFMSYLYKQGAKSACKAHDQTYYKFFWKLQIKDFGIDQPNTKEILEYCDKHNMELFETN